MSWSTDHTLSSRVLVRGNKHQSPTELGAKRELRDVFLLQRRKMVQIQLIHSLITIIIFYYYYYFDPHSVFRNWKF